jgi:hypothetical protein
LIDWLMELPPELQEGFRQELHTFEEARHMPYVTSIERLAKKEGLREGRQEGRQEGARAELLETIRAGLKDRFGSAGSRLMGRVRAIDDLPRLRALVKGEPLQAFHDLLE